MPRTHFKIHIYSSIRIDSKCEILHCAEIAYIHCIYIFILMNKHHRYVGLFNIDAFFLNPPFSLLISCYLSVYSLLFYNIDKHQRIEL